MIIRILRIIALCVILLITHNAISIAQVNLVTNPSFELLTSCPDFGNEIDSALGWSALRNGGGSTPDLFSVCCTLPSLCGVPSQTSLGGNGGGFQYPHSGKNYVGIISAASFYPDAYREYIQSKLLQKLKANNSYCVKFYCNLSNCSGVYIKSLGAYLDSGSISTPEPIGLAVATPQMFSQQSLIDTLNWMKVEGSFVATGIEEYISIGNFFPDSLSGMGLFGSSSGGISYYYIDDVSVINTNLPAYAGKDTLIHPGDSVFIGRQPEVGLNEDCIWFVNGLPIDTIAGLWVKPDSTTTYILEQTICGNLSWDTVTVSVYGTGIGAYTKDGKDITLYPNPATNTLNIESSTKFSQLLISDVLGNEIIKQQIYNHAVSVDVSGLGKGLYFVKMVGEKRFVVKRFLKE